MLLILFGLLISAAVSIMPFVLIFWLIRSLFRHLTGKDKGNTSKKEAKLLKELKKYFKNSYQIKINDEIYLELEKDDVNLNNIAVYIRNEYVSSLQQYKTAFPNAFNAMIDVILKVISKQPVQKEKIVNNKKDKPEEVKIEKPQTKTPVRNAKSFIDQFNKLDVAIEDEQISSELVKCQDYLKQIEKIEKEFPETKEKTGKLYQYYLPMLVDILEEYCRLSDNASNHKEFEESKQKLAKTIMLINSALETISATLCQEYYTDMSVDIKTLEALLKKDGYGNAMDINNFRKEKQLGE